VHAATDPIERYCAVSSNLIDRYHHSLLAQGEQVRVLRALLRSVLIDVERLTSQVLSEPGVPIEHRSRVILERLHVHLSQALIIPPPGE
jgi:hypothetical protein